MKHVLTVIAVLAFCAACATPTQRASSTAAVADLAPTGKLRAGINYGNPVLVQRDAASGGPKGLAVDLAQELGRRLGVPVELVTYDAAGKMADAVKTEAWDIAFLAVDCRRQGLPCSRHDSPHVHCLLA